MNMIKIISDYLKKDIHKCKIGVQEIKFLRIIRSRHRQSIKRKIIFKNYWNLIDVIKVNEWRLTLIFLWRDEILKVVDLNTRKFKTKEYRFYKHTLNDTYVLDFLNFIDIFKLRKLIKTDIRKLNKTIHTGMGYGKINSQGFYILKTNKPTTFIIEGDVKDKFKYSWSELIEKEEDMLRYKDTEILFDMHFKSYFNHILKEKLNEFYRSKSMFIENSGRI